MLIILIGVACLIGSFAAVAVLTNSSAALLAHGTRVPGTVAYSGNALDQAQLRENDRSGAGSLTTPETCECPGPRGYRGTLTVRQGSGL